MNGTPSPLLNCDLGTPQGSNFGPMCFALYLNDIFKLFDDSVSVVGYADDCAVVISGHDVDELVSRMNEILVQVSDWCSFNKLAINIEKTKYMFLTNKLIRDCPIQVKGNNLERVYKFNYLGVTVSSKMKYSDHIKSLENKLAQLSTVVRLKRCNFSLHIAKLFYYGYVYSTVSYNIGIWGSSLMVYQFERLRRLHDRIIVNLFSFHVGSTDLNVIYRSLGILKLDDIFRYHAMTCMFKLNCTSKFHAFGMRENNAVRRNRFTGDLYVPTPRNDAYRLSHRYQYPLIWNNIPSDIRSSKFLSRFKRNLRQHYLKHYE